MFEIAILIGIISYVILGFGVLSLLYPPLIIAGTILVVLIFAIVVSKVPLPLSLYYQRFDDRKMSIYGKYALVLVIALAVVYFVGALTPELSFDALWYHLTLPKIFLADHEIHHIAGGLLYYSDMPKLVEMLYVVALSVGDEITAKIIHWGFGVLLAISLYLFSRKFLSKTQSVLVVLVFYSNLVVAWESTTAYIDLGRAFFEFLAFWGFINYLESGKKEWFVESAVMMGLAISTKLIAASSLLIFVLLIFSVLSKDNLVEKCKKVVLFVGVALCIPLPWFVLSYMATGNPVYPLFSGYPVAGGYLHPVQIIRDLWTVFTAADDPISPVYIIFLPLVIVLYKRFPWYVKVSALYVGYAVLAWVILPKTGGGRFMMVYLPVFSFLVVGTLALVKNSSLKFILTALIVLIALITLVYRSAAQVKYIPYLVGKESKEEFLSENLNYNFGDFYDVDRYFQGAISKDDRVLIYGIHNLYYVDFPFTHDSYITGGEEFNYILTGKDVSLPQRFSAWTPVYENTTTGVSLYKFGGQKWQY